MTSDKTTSPQDWWATSIIEMQPGVIRFRGYEIQDLIGRVGFAHMVYLLTRGELPSADEAKLLEAALVAAVDHGPQAPSIAIARMAMTCGVGINNAMASATNVLGDVHGGAGEACVGIYYSIAERISDHASDAEIEAAVTQRLAELKAEGVQHIPGFGHRFHPIDPRVPRLLELVDAAAARNIVSGRFARIGRAFEAAIAKKRGGKVVPMNIDGATGVIFAELGFAPPLCRGLFVLSRSVGALAHAWEQSQSPDRNKGPIPRNLIWTYNGPKKRALPEGEAN